MLPRSSAAPAPAPSSAARHTRSSPLPRASSACRCRSEKLIAALPALHAALGSFRGSPGADGGRHHDYGHTVQDRRDKFCRWGNTVRIAGIAKGAGMIHPQLQSAPGPLCMPPCWFISSPMPPSNPRAAADLLHHAVERRSIASPSMAILRPTTPFCCWPAGPAESPSRATSHDTRTDGRRPADGVVFSPRCEAFAYRWPSRSWRTGKAFSTWSSSTSAGRSPMRMLCA